MRLLEAVAELLAPTRCAGCEMPGSVLCERCAIACESIDSESACPRCGAPFGSLVCTECWDRELAFEAALGLGEFTAPLRRVVALHKDGPERRLGHVLGRMLGRRVGAVWPGWADVVCWIPTSPAALRRRGFDHAAGLAQGVAAELELPLWASLERRDARDQRGLGRDERAHNVAEVFVVRDGATRRRVLLVDDVLTTCATADAASSALLDAGVEAVRVAAAARTW